MAKKTESQGKCSLCGVSLSKRQMPRHLSKCAYPEGVKTAVVQVRVDAPGTPFWLDVGDDFFGSARDECSMDARVSASLPPAGSTFSYEYDYGSTTQLRLKVVAHRNALGRRENVRLLARNDDPVWTCNECDATATAVCAYCFNEDDAFFCDAHADEHDCGEEAMLPVVNSPRMGVCGYTG